MDPLFEDALIRRHDRRLWTALAVISLVALLLAVANIRNSHPLTRTYLVTIDRNGEPTAAARPIESVSALPDVVVQWALMEFVRDAMTVISNVDEQKEMIKTALAFARQQAAQALKAFYFDGKHYPWDLYQKSWVEVRITHKPFRMPTPGVWEVDWTTVKHDYGNDFAMETTNWRAVMKVDLTEPDPSDRRNPLGLYITTLTLSPEAQ
jgi:type IV secretory pathway TrbF-like protein